MSKLNDKMFKEAMQNLNSTLFIMFLGTIGGFIGGNITSCALQKIIQDKVWVSHVIFLLIIYFTSSFTGGGMHPIHTAILTVILYLLFTIIMKNHYIALLLGMFLFLLSYQVEKYIEYLEKNPEQYKTEIPPTTPSAGLFESPEKLRKLKVNLQYVGVSVFVIGFVVYLLKQMKDKGSQFNFGKFLFGTGKCTNL